MSHLLAISIFGSEVRQFGHSGLMQAFLDAGWTVSLAARKPDAEFRAQWDSRINFALLPMSHLPLKLRETIVVLDKAHALREARQGNSVWSYKLSTPKNWKQHLLLKGENAASHLLASTKIGTKIASCYEHYQINHLSESGWTALFDAVQPDVVVLNVPRVNSLLPCIAEAKRRCIPVVLLYHTSKDVTAAGRINTECDCFGVWNLKMQQELLRQNPQLDPAHVHIVGCTHFSCVGADSPRLADADLRRQFRIEETAPLILYTAAAPWILPNEELYIERLQNAITDGDLPANTHVLIRTNPMDNSSRWEQIFRASNVHIAAPQWHWEPQQNWCYQRREDLWLYNSLLSSASVCVGIPSTVTIECAITQTPVVNIGFELPNAKPTTGSMASFWEAEFYTDVRQTGAALRAATPAMWIEQISAAIHDRALLARQQSALIEKTLGVSPSQAVNAAFNLINTFHSQSYVSNM